MRIKPFKPRYLVKDFTNWMIAEMTIQKVTQEEMAELIGITQPSFWRKIQIGRDYDGKKNCPFSFKDFCIIVDRLQASDTMILKFIKI